MIGIYGDSYGDCNPEELIDSSIDRMPWPMILSNLLDEGMQPHARAATSIWWSFRKFLKTYKKYDTIIFCYSNHNRWPNINLFPYEENNDKILGLHHIFRMDQLNMVHSEDLHIAEKLVGAHPYIFSNQLSIFLYQSLFNEINRRCKEEGIKIVNLLPFEEFEQKRILSFDTAAGPCITNMTYIGHREFYYDNHSLKLRDKRLAVLEKKPDRRFCHINPYNNKIIALVIKEALDNDTKYVNVDNDPRFSYDIKHLEYLL